MIVRQATPDSSSPIFRAVHPAWPESLDSSLLRSVEHSLRVLRWQQTEDARWGTNAPEPVRLPWDPEPEGALVGDALPFDEMFDFLGWDIPDDVRELVVA